MDANPLRGRQFLLCTTMLVAAMSGYGRRAYAACDPATPPNFVCSGANNTQQTIAANDASVTTVPGFSVVTPDPIAVQVTGDGALSYTDVNYSTLTATNTALYIRSNGDVAGGNPGSVTVNTNGALTGGVDGIRALNYGSGALSVTANGDVTGTNRYGIRARNFGTDLSVTTGTGTTVTGGTLGIYARNDGTGALTITANGDTRGGFTGIEAQNNGTDLSVVSNGTVSGNQFGIRARNEGSGALSVTANGDVTSRDFLAIYARNSANGTDLDVTIGDGANITGSSLGIIARNYGADLSVTTGVGSNVTGTSYAGIFADNRAGGENLNVTTGTDSTTSGARFGLQIRNYGTGALTVTANGDVKGTGNYGYGIHARNSAYGTDLSVTTGAGTMVSGAYGGIRARNYGTGALSVTANGDVAGTNSIGIYAWNSASGTDLTAITEAGTAVSGQRSGIYARNYGTGAMSVTANGDVTGTSATSYGIFARNRGTDLDIITGPGSNVAGGDTGIDAQNLGSGDMTVSINGDVSGTNFGGAELFNFGDDMEVTTAVGTTVSGTALGLRASNNGDGALTMNINGDVTGTNGTGLYAVNFANATDLTVTTGVGSNVTSSLGLFSRSFGSGDMTITANGDVIGTGSSGIEVRNYADDVTVNTGAFSTVTGNFSGIVVRNDGAGALAVNANGDVAGVNNYGVGIQARNNTGTNLAITTGAGADVAGGADGIRALNYGTGALSVTTNGDVTGINGIGIYARNDGTDLSVSTGSGTNVTGGNTGVSARNYGTGALTVTANGDLAGADSAGIFAENSSAGTSLTIVTSAGTTTSGYSGILARNYGTGALSVTADGDVTGTNAAGIYARHFNGGPIDVTVAAGATTAGGTAGVQLVDGAANSLTNFGTVRNLNGIGGTAIVGGTGSETVSNFGFVEGNVDLGTGLNAFDNLQGGLFNSGTTVNLGAGNTLTNSGALSPGGTGSILTTSLTGNFVQTSSGRFLVDLEGVNADRVDATGSAVVDGRVNPNYTLENLAGADQWTILTATTPIVDNGIKVASPSPVVQFDLIFPTATQMDLVLDVDFAVSGLNRNETAIAENLNAVFDSGNFKQLSAMLNAIAALPSERAVANALDQLSPEVYLDTQIGTLFSALSFTNSLMSCPVYAGANAFIKEGQCVWAQVSGRSFKQDRTFESFGIDESSFQIAGGVQGALGEVWRLGLAGAFEQGNLDTSTDATSDFDRAHAGAVLKYNPGPLLLAAAVSGGWGGYDTNRPIHFPGFHSLATSDHDVSYIDGRLRAAYLLTNGQWYAKPLVDLDATRISLEHVSEHAKGGVGLHARGNEETVLSATPALELGMQFGSEGGTLFRPYIRGGATFFDDPSFALLASFEGSPSGVGPFRIATETDDVVAVLAAGVDVIGVGGASLRLYYDGRFGETVEAHEGGIKAGLAF